jgi:hypothetical protein
MGAVDEPKPVWTTPSFLIYAGGLTVLGAALGALGYLAANFGKAAFAGWALLVLAVLYAIAHAFKRRGHWLTAGIFAYASVVAWAVFVVALWVWFGWFSTHDIAQSPLHGFSFARLSFEALVLAAVFDDIRRFRFPFIASIGVLFGWLFVADLISGGGSWTAVVTLLLGLVYLAVGSASSRPSAFWLHVGAGVLIGGSLLYWWHSSDWNWALVAVVALAYISTARATRRSSWAVFGVIGLLFAASHFADAWSHGSSSGNAINIGIAGFGVPYHGWVPPLVFAFTGFLLVALGLGARRRHAE